MIEIGYSLAEHTKHVSDYLTAQGYQVDIADPLFDAFQVIAVRWPYDVRLIQVINGGNVEAIKTRAYKIWPNSEVWEYNRGDRYWIHRLGQASTLIGTREWIYG